MARSFAFVVVSLALIVTCRAAPFVPNFITGNPIWPGAVSPSCGCGSTVISPAPVTNIVSSLVAPAIAPSCGCNSCLSGLNVPSFASTIAPVIQAPAVLPAPIAAPAWPSALAPVVTISDDTVSNNLANVLQLLVVSNLLDNSLPMKSLPIGVMPSPCGLY